MIVPVVILVVSVASLVAFPACYLAGFIKDRGDNFPRGHML